MKEQFQQWIDEDLTQKQMAVNLGCSQAYVAKLLKRYELKTHRANRAPRYCERCDTKLKGQKRFCSYVCSAQSRHDELVSLWLAGEYPGSDKMGLVSNFVRRHLYEIRGEQCELCEWNEVNPFTGKTPLVIHHIDGDAENERPENLQILCGNCHSLTPNFGGLNRGNGRKARYTC